MTYFFNNYYSDTNLIPTDLYPIQYGEEQCNPGHDFGPCIRNNHLIHYVYSGSGILRIGGKEYPVTEGQLFFIPARVSAYYKADSKSPWLYRWIEFNGTMAPKILNRLILSAERPILSDTSDCPIGKALQQIVQNRDMPFEVLMGYFWGFIAALTRQSPPENSESNTGSYIKQAEVFIQNNLHKNISVQDVSDYIGIDRSYLCRLFNEHKNVSPKQYLEDLKMKRATQYLKLPNLSVTEVALSLGYSDCHAFHKAFKKNYGCSPSAWREKSEFEQTLRNITPNTVDVI